jgi:hypothetical protein
MTIIKNINISPTYEIKNKENITVDIVQEYFITICCKVAVLDSLMGCDLGNICARAERQTSEKSVLYDFTFTFCLFV